MKNLSDDPLVRLQECRGESFAEKRMTAHHYAGSAINTSDPREMKVETSSQSFIACKVDESCGQTAFDEEAERINFTNWAAQKAKYLKLHAIQLACDPPKFGGFQENDTSIAWAAWLACAKSKAEGK